MLKKLTWTAGLVVGLLGVMFVAAIQAYASVFFTGDTNRPKSAVFGIDNYKAPGSISTVDQPGHGTVWKFTKPAGDNRCEAHGIKVNGSMFKFSNNSTYYIAWESSLSSTTDDIRQDIHAVRLAIPSIKLDTPVQQAGIVEDAHGNPVWQTLPFVAVHYGDLTALIGQAGNAVIAGHVVTLNEGNVFRFLYQLDLDDQIQVWDDHERERDYHVVDVRLVPPTDTSVMDPTPDETLTLITCGGTFDPIRREFSDRLIVVAKPV